jgi:membrane fusion protein (multidrug efflux system)
MKPESHSPPSRPPAVVLATMALVLAGGLLAGCGVGSGEGNPAPGPVEVGVVTLSVKPVTLTTELAGRTTAFLTAQIRPQVGGILQQREFIEGAMVTAGQTLYQIDPASYQATYESAQASVARAEATLDAARLKAKRQSALLAIEAVSHQDNEDAQVAMQQAQADLAAAKAARETARINLAYTRIASPISGRVETSTVTPGALLTANQDTALTTVQQIDPIYVDIPQSSVDVLRLRQAVDSGKLGAAGKEWLSIKLRLEDGTLYRHPGKLQFNGLSVNTTTGAITLRALVPNPEHLLLPGMYVRAELEQGVVPQAIVVPAQGISRDATGGATALVVGKDNKVEARPVTVADQMVGQGWRVMAGLVAGERVIIEGAAKVRPGVTVNPVSLAAANGASPTPTAQ